MRGWVLVVGAAAAVGNGTPVVVGERKKMAVVIFGTTHHWNPVKGRKEGCPKREPMEEEWHKTAKLSLKRFVLDEVRASGFKPVDVFVSIDDCKGSRDDLRYYKPYLRGVQTSGPWSSRHAKLKKGLKLMDKAKTQYDFVVLTRPDILWYQPVDVARLTRDGGIVWPSKCELAAWKRFQCVSDIFISAAGDALAGLRQQCERELFDKFLASGHYTYDCAVKKHVVDLDAARFYLGNDTNLVVNQRGRVGDSRILLPFFMPGGPHAHENLVAATHALSDARVQNASVYLAYGDAIAEQRKHHILERHISLKKDASTSRSSSSSSSSSSDGKKQPLS
mmetsp:Transcript_16836/g.52633  ORF Transcript_16836/g.52633 Transcript_16836/m.52633 type:complete len:335 (+) Transcript_16836:53-1057(+)